MFSDVFANRRFVIRNKVIACVEKSTHTEDMIRPVQRYNRSGQVLANEISGGYCGGVPPLPIPNREVKPTSADGTAMQCGRVGNRLLLTRSSETNVLGLLFLFCITLALLLHYSCITFASLSYCFIALFGVSRKSVGIGVYLCNAEKEELFISYPS